MPNRDYIEENSKYIYDAILSLENAHEVQLLFTDMCTDKEFAAIAQRFAVARMLSEDAKYNEIVEATGASTATISRVKRSMGAGGGYDIVFSRLKGKD